MNPMMKPWIVAVRSALEGGVPVGVGLPGVRPISLIHFRQRLIEHQQERYAFDRFITVGRAPVSYRTG